MKQISGLICGAVALAVWLAAPSPAAAQFNLDSYKCYKAKDLKQPKFIATTVSLDDQFTDGTYTAKKPFVFCNPVDKGGAGILNATDHLTCYKIKGPKFDGPNVQIANDFGSLKLDTKKPFLLCVPSLKQVL